MLRLLGILLVIAALPCAVAAQVGGQAGGQAVWIWKDSKKVVHTRAELDAILRSNQVLSLIHI